ncbi:MAG: glycosyltransferase family 9 protein [Candidatus Schekmanbacteria bacterium]|nr:glycosyltransferase family 9 protein [Candidatus Schekmanbacteria bacterium]
MKPLVVRVGALGDLVMCTPALRYLSRRFGAPVDVLARDPAPALFAQLPFVGSVYSLRSKRTPFWLDWSQWGAVRFVGAEGPRPLFVFEDNRKIDWLIERGRAGGPLISFRDHRRLGNEHQIEQQLRLCAMLIDGAPPPLAEEQREPWTEVRVDEMEIQRCRRFLSNALGAGDAPILVVHPGNSRTQRGRGKAWDPKFWPLSHWKVALAEILRADADVRILISGVAAESRIAEELVRAIPGNARARSIAGELDVRGLAAVLCVATGCISIDTGPAHLAAAVGCPLVVLFGGTDPRVNRPVARRSPVQVVTDVHGGGPEDSERSWAATHDITRIEPGQVVAAWEAIAAARR